MFVNPSDAYIFMVILLPCHIFGRIYYILIVNIIFSDLVIVSVIDDHHKWQTNKNAKLYFVWLEF